MLHVCVSLRDACHPGVKRYFPPQLNDLAAWSMLFQCVGTLNNYLGYVKTATMVVGASVQVYPALND